MAPPILSGWFRRFWPNWATTHASTGEGDAGNQLLAQNEYVVQTGGRLSPLLAHHPETVDGDALLLQKDAPAVEKDPRTATSAKGSGILPMIARLMGTTR